MVAAGDSGLNYAQRLGIHQDQIVQEMGWDEDTDDDIRADVEDACGSELLDEDADDVIDVVLLWWRDGDGDPGGSVDGRHRAVGRRRNRVGTDAEKWVNRARAARRYRRGRTDGRTDADLVGEPR